MLTDEQLEALATLHLAPQMDAAGQVDLMPLLRAVSELSVAAARADKARVLAYRLISPTRWTA